MKTAKGGKVVLDASAILALLIGEPGAEAVREHIPDSVASAVNVAEVAAKLADHGVKDSEIREIIGALGIEVAPCDADLAFASATLRRQSRKAGLSLGDRMCLALARLRDLPALTADKRWLDLDLGVEIRSIR